MDFGAALIAFVSARIVKIAVMGLSVWLIWKVHGATRTKDPKQLWLLLPRENIPEVRILWWALVLFFVSELTCGIEVYIILRSSPVLAGAHAVTSAAGMALFLFGLYRFFDKKLFRFGGTGCLGNRICAGCTVTRQEGCKFSLVLLLLSVFVLLAALVPLFASTAPMVADPTRYILPFPTVNAWYEDSLVPWFAAHLPGYRRDGVAYVLPRAMFVIELRVIPGIACVLGVVAAYFAVRRAVVRSAYFVVIGAGVLAYAYFELVLYRGIGEALLGSLGHEVGELWFLAITAELLRRSFPKDRAAEAAAQPT